MATTFTATGYSSDTARSSGLVGYVKRTKLYELTAALVASDIIQFFKLPVGAKPIDAHLVTDDLDTATSLTFTLRITDGTTTKNLFASNTVGQAAGIARMDLIAGPEWKTDNGDYRLEAFVSDAPGTGTATGTLVACLEYTMDLETEE